MNYALDYYQKFTLILGCGNILFGDDGFGPAVIDYLKKHCHVPAQVSLLDVGTGAREVLFDLILAEEKPQRLIVIDALDCNKEAGEIFTISVDCLPENEIDDFSLHQLPTSNLFKELSELCRIEVIILAAQPEYVPETVDPGLSQKLQEAVPRAAEYIVTNYF